MKRIALGMLSLGSLILAGCDSEGPKQPDTPQYTVAVYAPSASAIPLPNDLIFNGTTDLTLNVPVDDETDFSDPQVAISGLDGWSTVAPFSITFRHPDSAVTLSASSVVPGSTVRILEVLADTDIDNPLFGATPTFAPYEVVRELTPVTDFVAVASGTSVAVVPTKPLTPRATYIVLATNGIQDSNGNAVIKDGQYDLVSSQTQLLGSLAALTPVQTLVNTYENLAASAGINKDNIVVSFAFTTQSVGNVMGAAKGLYIDYPYSLGVSPATGFTATGMTTNDLNAALAGVANVYVGQITLNYMLEAPSANNPTAPLNDFWKAADYVPDGLGGMVANPLAGGHLTYKNKLPQITGTETAPLLLTVPNHASCVKPAGGFPIMIFQHGITSNRTAALGIADTMAAPPLCTAVVSMDMPLHGVDATAGPLFTGYTAGGLRERTFGVDYVNNTTGAPGPDGVVDTSGKHTINLLNLLVSRDNLRQAIFDLLTLEKAIGAMDYDGGGADFDLTKVYFMGHSLGGIVGSSFVAYSDLISVAVLANPGGGIAGLLDGSDTFGPVIQAGLAGAGVEAGSADYFKFLFAAQTAVDSGDPINTTTVAITNNIPTLMLRNEGDAVVPNNTATYPLSGTDPLASYLGLTTVAATNPGDYSVGGRQISRLNSGLHSTVLTPAGPNGATEFLPVTTEMQTHIATFIGSAGTAVQVADPTLLD